MAERGNTRDRLGEGARVRAHVTELIWQTPAGQRFEIAEIDRVALPLGNIQSVDDADRIANIAVALFGIEWAVAGEHDAIGPVKLQAADCRRTRAEHGAVGVKILLEIVERPLLQAIA